MAYKVQENVLCEMNSYELLTVAAASAVVSDVLVLFLIPS